MRYNPDTERSINIDEIAAQCRAAIMRSQQEDQKNPYDEVLQFARWEQDLMVAV